MADDPAGQAIGIIGALQEAGLLRTGTSEPAAELIGALSEAGLLAGAPSTPEPPAPPEPEPLPLPQPQVGDVVWAPIVRGVNKFIDAVSGKVTVRLTADPRVEGEPTFQYYLEFPPNDESWLPEIDKIITTPKHPPEIPFSYNVAVSVEITSLHYMRHRYYGELKALGVGTWFYTRTAGADWGESVY
jgi:hypothetical protein